MILVYILELVCADVVLVILRVGLAEAQTDYGYSQRGMLTKLLT